MLPTTLDDGHTGHDHLPVLARERFVRAIRSLVASAPSVSPGERRPRVIVGVKASAAVAEGRISPVQWIDVGALTVRR